MDSLGKDSFTDSLDCLHPLGIMISFGDLSGLVTGLDLGMLARNGSLQQIAHWN
jgi:NADPH2:quinone reductase